MTSEDWKRAWELFEGASELPEPERQAFLARAGARTSVLDAVRRLLERQTAGPSAPEPARGAARHGNGGELWIGPYRILRTLGEGGMGAVYLAQQEAPLRRTVAIKVVRPGLKGREAQERFEVERRALALMEHRHIARVFDAGDTPEGRPYFVMEYVPGVPIQRYCDEQRLPLRARMELLVQVCQAVQHAHQRGVIHRDLKPSNVLVAAEEGQPVVKVIDFGVAKATQADLGVVPSTRFGSVLGTLEYMSPEQATGDPAQVDTRSDVYSLGVLAYELIAGAMPFGAGKPETEWDLAAALERIRLREPMPPSRRLRTSPALASLAEQRSTGPERLAREAEGDLDWIVMRALENEPVRRYQTAHGLALDIQRYLSGDPVDASPPSTFYRARKLAAKHRTWLLAAAGFAAILVVATVVSVGQAIRATAAERVAVAQRERARAAEQSARGERDRAHAAEQAARGERDRALAAERQSELQRQAALRETARADTQRATAEAITDFLRNDLLTQADVNNQPGGGRPDPDLKVRTALDRAAVRVDDRFAGQPEVEASIRLTIGRTYLDLGVGEEAERQIQRAIALRRDALGERHPETLAAVQSLGMAYGRIRGRYPEAERILERIVGEYRARLGERHFKTIQAQGNLSVVYLATGKYAQAERLLTSLAEHSRRVRGGTDDETLWRLLHLASALGEQGKHTEALRIKTWLLEICKATRNEQDPLTILAVNNLAAEHDRLGQYGKAEPLFLQAIALAQANRGEEHPTTLLFENNLADLERKTGRLDDAERRYGRVLRARTRVLGPDNPDTLITMMSLGRLYRSQGHSGRAGDLFMQILEARRRKLGAEHPYTLITLYELALTRESEGKAAEAEGLHGRVLEVRRRLLGAQAPATLLALLALGRVRLLQGKHGEAEAALRECISGYQKVDPLGWRLFHAQSMLGTSLARRGEFAEAEALLTAGYQGMVERQATIPSEERIVVAHAGEWLARLYELWGKSRPIATIPRQP